MPANSSTQEESAQERPDRELDQLLNELRVAMPGVQVLFAFPFQQRFGSVTEFQKDVYFVTLLAAAAASALFIAPTAYHRLVFREGDKPQLIEISSKLVIAGLWFALGAVRRVSGERGR